MHLPPDNLYPGLQEEHCFLLQLRHFSSSPISHLTLKIKKYNTPATPNNIIKIVIDVIIIQVFFLQHHSSFFN